MNDDFFKLYGVEEGGEAKFREDVQGNMERELRNAIRRQELKTALWISCLTSIRLMFQQH